MRHPGQQPGVAFFGDGEEGARGVLLQDAVDDLEAGQPALTHGRHPFLFPADVRPQGRAVVTHLPLPLQLLQRLEQFIALDGRQARVMKLVQVDVVRPQAAQALLTGPPHEGGGEVLGKLLVAAALLAVAKE